MAYGLRTKNDAGEFQIDGDYVNLGLIESHLATNVANDNTNAGYTTLINFDTPISTIPLILIRPDTDQYVQIDSYVKSGDNYTGFYATTKYSQSTAIDWKLYTPTKTKSSAEYGIRVYDSDESLVFDNDINYFAIHAVESVTLSNPTTIDGNNQTINHPNISNPYYLLAPLGYWFIGIGAPVRVLMIFRTGIKKIDANNVSVGQVCIRLGATNVTSAEGWNPTFKLLICDVR